MLWTSASTSEGRVPADGTATTESGSSLLVRVAGGWWGRARGLHALPGLLGADGEPPADDSSISQSPTALWLGRTPQVHTWGMTQPIAVVIAEATRPGRRRGRPNEIRVRGVEVLIPGRLGRWSWPPPITLELHPAAVERLGLAVGSALNLDWGSPGRRVAP